MSIEEGKRRRLTPLYGLIVLGLAAIILEFQASWDGLRAPISSPMRHGNCMYQAFQEGECLGTVFLGGPATIPQVLEGIGVTRQAKCEESQDQIPCDRALILTRDLRVNAIEKIKGTHLIFAGKRIDLNSAGLEDLRAIPGIGPRLAERIIGERDARGRFSRPEELGKIHGIGKKKLAGWGPYIQAGPSGVIYDGPQNIQTSGGLLEPQGPIHK